MKTRIDNVVPDSEIKIFDIHSLVNAVNKAYDKFDGQVWWRGQRCTEWKLIPSVFRRENLDDEVSMSVRFQQLASMRHQRVPEVNDWSSWLFLMQHYRLPTRLLDWTESPLVAAFFASEIGSCENNDGSRKLTDGALYALSPYKLNNNQIQVDKLLMPEDNNAKPIFRRAFNHNVKAVNRIVAVRPPQFDIRLLVQQSTFTLHNDNLAIDTINGHDSFLIKFVVQGEAKTDIHDHLKYLGIRDCNIFPDLEHLAKEISGLQFKNEHSLGNRPAEPSNNPEDESRGPEKST